MEWASEIRQEIRERGFRGYLREALCRLRAEWKRYRAMAESGRLSEKALKRLTR